MLLDNLNGSKTIFHSITTNKSPISLVTVLILDKSHMDICATVTAAR